MADPTGTAVPTWLSPETLEALDAWRESQMAPPSRSRAISSILAAWLEANAPAPKRKAAASR